jgi:hypothetical protein
VLLMLQRRRADSVPQAAEDLHGVFVRRARELTRGWNADEEAPRGWDRDEEAPRETG